MSLYPLTPKPSCERYTVEVGWNPHRTYLTLLTDHTRGKVVWGKAGKDTAALDALFDELGAQRAARIEAVSKDMGTAFNKSVRAEGHAPQAVICIDRSTPSNSSPTPWTPSGAMPGTSCATAGTGGGAQFQGRRWALLKNPTNLSDEQTENDPHSCRGATMCPWSSTEHGRSLTLWPVAIRSAYR
jgi:transposase